MEPALIKVKEASELMNVHRNFLYTLIAQGRIPGVVRVGKAVRINKRKLLDWLEGEGVNTNN